VRFRDARIEAPFELQKLPLRHGADRVCEDPEDVEVAVFDDHRRRPRVQEVPDQDRAAIAPERVGRRTAAAQLREVHDVVVKQRRGVQQLDRRAHLDASRSGVAAELRREQDQRGPNPLAARLEHVWVKAHLDYIPHRGSAPGPGDTWVRMDAALKRFDLAEGIQIYDQVPFDFDVYLESGPGLSPLHYYQDALWSHIRTNDIDCVTLDQLKRKRQLRTAAYPFVPGTLKAPVLRLDGESETVPESFMPHLARMVGSHAAAADRREPAATAVGVATAAPEVGPTA